MKPRIEKALIQLVKLCQKHNVSICPDGTIFKMDDTFVGQVTKDGAWVMNKQDYRVIEKIIK